MRARAIRNDIHTFFYSPDFLRPFVLLAFRRIPLSNVEFITLDAARDESIEERRIEHVQFENR